MNPKNASAIAAAMRAITPRVGNKFHMNSIGKLKRYNGRIPEFKITRVTGSYQKYIGKKFQNRPTLGWILFIVFTVVLNYVSIILSGIDIKGPAN